MATANSVIQKSNFSTSWQKTWEDSHGSKDQVRYVYVCAACWAIQAYVKTGIFGSSGVFQIHASYWTGSAWSSETHWEVNGTSSTHTDKFTHNRSESGTKATIDNTYPLWRFRYWPSRGNSNWRITVYAGGWGVATTNYPTGKKIYSIGRIGDCIHSSGTTSQQPGSSGFPFVYSNRTGSPILASADHELVNYPYLS